MIARASTGTPAELRALGVASGELDLFAVLQPGVRRRHPRVLRPRRPARAGARHRGHGRARGDARARADPRAAGPALRPRAPLDGDVDSGASDRVPRAWPRATPSASRTSYSCDELTDEERDGLRRGVRRASWPRARRRPRTSRRSCSANFGAPYVLGPAVRHDARQPRRERRRRPTRSSDPPTTEEHLFDPASFTSTRRADDVELGFDEDAEVFDEGTFGSTGWYLVLAERIDPKVAFEAALGWDGDGYAVYRARRHAPASGPPSWATPTEDEDADGAALDRGSPPCRAAGAELDRGRRPPGARGLRPRRGASTCELTGRSESSLFLPQPVGLPRGRRHHGARSRRRLAATRAPCSTTSPTRRSPTPTGRRSRATSFDQTLSAALEACR